MSKKWLKWVPMVVALFISCSHGTIFNEYKSTPIMGWEKNDTLSFEVPKLARGGTYDMELGIRINGAYPFTALTLIVEQTVLPSGKTYKDTIDCKLVDPKGREMGSGISYFQYSFPVRETALAAGDSLHVNIRHDMKREMLPGISDIGIMINNTGLMRSH